MFIQIHTNDEIEVNGKVIGWATTYNQARSKNREAFPGIEHEKCVFWPMTEDRTRREYHIINHRLDDTSGKWNEATIAEMIKLVEAA